MNWKICVSFFKSIILFDVMEIVPSDNDSSLHFSRNDHSLENSASDGDIGSERAFLINIRSFNGFSGGLEAYSKIRRARSPKEIYLDQFSCSI